MQTLCSNNEGSMKIEEQQEGKCLRTGLWDICIYLYLQCGLKHINQHILTSKNTVGPFYILFFTPKTASIPCANTHTPKHAQTHAHQV